MEPGESDIAQRGRILVDWEIREYANKYGMIEPFENHLVREGVISYGLSSIGYDIRIADEFKIFTNINTTVVDPKHFDPRSFIDIRSEWQALDNRIEALNGEFVAIARHDEAARRLVTIPGVGVLNATALVAAVGNGAAFKRGRDLGAWLGLVPKQHTTGGKPRLLGISKRGNKYLRMLFIHGARAAMPSLAASQSPLGEWLRGLLARTHRNIAIVALANKLARIAWATLRRKTGLDLRHLAVAG